MATKFVGAACEHLKGQMRPIEVELTSPKCGTCLEECPDCPGARRRVVVTRTFFNFTSTELFLAVRVRPDPPSSP